MFLGISRDFAEIPEFRGSATARNTRSPASKKMRVRAKDVPYNDNTLEECY